MRELHWRSRLAGPIERVFDLAIEPAGMREMMPWIDDISDVKGRGDNVGDSFRFRERFLGRSRGAVTAVTEVERPTLQTTETTYDDGSTAIWTMNLAPTESGTLITNHLSYRLGTGPLAWVLEAIASPLIMRRMRECNGQFSSMLARAAVRHSSASDPTW
jgi:hypothetical protein